MVSLMGGVGESFWSNVSSSEMVRGRISRRGRTSRIVRNDGGLVLIGARHFLEDIAVIEDLGGVFVRKLEEVIKKAGICRLNERGFPVVLQYFVDQPFCGLELSNQKIFITSFFWYDRKFRNKFGSGSCQKSFDVGLFHS